MKYADGEESKAGDRLQIDGQYSGVVVACIDSGEYSPGHEHWAGLKEGVMVDTDFGGLVHYTQIATDELRLVARRVA